MEKYFKFSSVKTIFLLFSLFLITECGIFRPEKPAGMYVIPDIKQTGNVLYKSSSVFISYIKCIVKQGSDTVYTVIDDKSVNFNFSIKIRNLEPGNNYSVTIYAFDEKGDFILKGFSWGIKIRPDQTTVVYVKMKPFFPLLIFPEDKSFINNPSPVFRWAPVSDAYHYELNINNAENSKEPSFVIFTDSCFAFIENLPEDHTFFWQVRASDLKGVWGKWSTVFSFTVDTVSPASPSLILPVNNSVIRCDSILFKWACESTDIDFYEISISGQSYSAAPETLITDIRRNSYSFMVTYPNDTYVWKVRGVDFAGNKGRWSARGRIIIQLAVPKAPDLNDPPDGAVLKDGSPVFKWEKSENSVLYELCAAEDTTFNIPVLSVTDIDTCIYKPENPLMPGTYFWKVRAKDSRNNYSNWSHVWQFWVPLSKK